MRILFVSSEFHPYAKSGGLADAVASLAGALVARRHSVAVVMPRYESVPSGDFVDLRIPLGVPLGYREEWVGIHHMSHEGIDLYFLDHRELFGWRAGIYGPSPAEAYHDNLRRFSLLSRGALQLALALELRPDIIHAHDWPTALTPVFHRTRYGETPLARAGTVFSIHNFGYQGWYPLGQSDETGLSRDELESSGVIARGEINLVRGALTTAQRLVAVSPRYAREIQTEAFGFGLHRETRNRASTIAGILNGIDEDEWNPATDRFLPAHFSSEDRSGKAICKLRLEAEFGIPEDPDLPLVAMVTRLTEQKGIGSLFGPGYGSLHRICTELPVRFVFLGSGERWCEDEIRGLAAKLPNFAAIIGYDHSLAHRTMAAGDFILMPSTYEPCGLNQMYAMRYGTIPVVTRTGGLADTVDEKTGFFIEEYSPDGIFNAVRRAIETYTTRPDTIAAMRKSGMRRDFSWDRSAGAYEDLYGELQHPAIHRTQQGWRERSA